MTIPFQGDKIAPVADDGAEKAAENQVGRRRGGGTAGGQRAEEEEAEQRNRKRKKFLTNEMSFGKIYRLSLEKNDRNLDN